MQGVLHALVKTVADYHSVWGCAIHLCENGRLCLKASVDIPERLVVYLELLTQEHDGSPEQSAFSQCNAVVIHDLWKELKPWSNMLTAHNIQSAWSLPIRSVEGSVVGTLTVYSRLVHSPSEEEINVLEMAAQMAALILNHRSLHDQLFNRAYHDSLTGIPNRRFGDDSLGKAIGLAQRKGKLLGVLWMDIDHFKQINDTHGHAAGDAVLQEVANRVKKRLRTSDTVARMGGDEFMVVLQDIENPEDAIRVASNICEILSQPVAFGSLELPLHVSIGISLYPNDGETTESLEICADHAMYRAKKEKLGIFCGEHA
jgi:diguanylate cyclase (GGDEF)-like protein